MSITLAALGVDGMGETGLIFAEQRRKQGKSVQEVESATHIRKEFIEAIEAGELESLPSCYSEFFVRDYAQYLGIDPESLSEDMQSRQRISNSVPMVVLSSFEKKERGKILRAIGLAVLAIAVLFVIGVANWNWANRPLRTDPAGVKRSVSEPAPGKREAESKETPVQPQEAKQETMPRQVLIKLWVSTEPSWARIKTDDQVIYEGILAPGTYKELSGSDKIEIKVGNAGAVRITLNGQDLGILGGFRQVVNRTFTPETAM